MRCLVFLAGVACCSSLSIQAPSILNPIATIPTQYINNPYWSPNSPYTYSFPSIPTSYLNPDDATYKSTGFPFIWENVNEASPVAVAAAVVGNDRRRRDVKDIQDLQVPLPYIHAVPAIAKTTIQTKQLEKVAAATPADTTQLELTTKEREYTVPAVKYVQPVVKYVPRTYTALSPAVLPPYQYGLLPSLGYPFAPAAAAAPVITLQEE